MHARDQIPWAAVFREISCFIIMHTYAGGIRFVQFRFAVSDFGQQ
jgi:hypothetical protein